MKKIIFFFILSITFLSGFNSANAQLPFYEFGFNIYDNGERITDTNFYKVKFISFGKVTRETTNAQLNPAPDTSQTFGYDYIFINGGARLKDYIIQIIIERMEDNISQDVMHIEFDYSKAPLHSMLGIDKIIFKPGKFMLTNETWPKNRRDRPMDSRYFPFLDENFDWESIRTE